MSIAVFPLYQTPYSRKTIMQTNPIMQYISATRFFSAPKSVPVSISAYKKYGVTRTNLSYLCMNNWNFPDDFRDCLASYYLLQWEGKYFSDSLREGTIKHNEKEYIVVYKNCTYFKAKSAAQVRLSFREPKEEFGLPGYVIVSVFTESHSA